jgi:hypothetical protein
VKGHATAALFAASNKETEGRRKIAAFGHIDGHTFDSSRPKSLDEAQTVSTSKATGKPG